MKLVTDPGMIQNQTLLIILPGLGWAGLGWAWAGLDADSTLSTILHLSLLHQNVHEIVSSLSLSNYPTIHLVVCYIQPWSMISFISPSSVSHLCPGPLLPPDLHLRHWLGDMGAGGQLLRSPLFYIYYLASEAILQKWAVTLIGTSCIFLNPDGYVLWSVLYLLHGHSYDSITLIS